MPRVGLAAVSLQCREAHSRHGPAWVARDDAGDEKRAVRQFQQSVKPVWEKAFGDSAH
jgi:hypothetical protein